MDDYIDAGQATIITDRCKPPKNQAAAPSTVKSVLWCLRGLGAPGMTLSVPRGTIEDRTCLGETAVKKALKVLIDHEVLIQEGRPAPGRPARFTLDYRKLAEWLDPGDRQIIRLDNIKPDAGASRLRTPALSAPERGRDAPVSDSTQARGAASQARGETTQARSARDIKEVTALPAKPAAAAAERPSAEVQLTNLAAAAAAVIDFEGWVRIGTRAGLVPGMAGQCAHALIELGIQDAHTGRRALERLAERLSRLKNPTGFFRTMLTQDGGPDPSIASFKRDRTTTARRAKLLDAMDGWPPDALGIVAAKTRALLERELGEDIARELIPAGQFAHPIRGWAEMLDFIAARYDDIRAVQLQAEAVA